MISHGLTVFTIAFLVLLSHSLSLSSRQDKNLTIPYIGNNLTSFENTPGILDSPLCYRCNVWTRLNQFWWSNKSYEYVHAIHQVIITIKEGNPVTSTSTYLNSLSTFDLNEDWDSTIVDRTTGASGAVFPTGYLAWYGYHGTRTCYPPVSAASYNGGPFAKAMAGKKAEYLEMVGTRTTALSPVPVGKWKTHFGIQTCTAKGAPDGGSVSTGQSISYVRVTYLTKTTTITATKGESVPSPVFSTTNGVESTIFPSMTSSAVISSFISLPTGLWNTSQSIIANDSSPGPFVFDAADWVDDHMPGIGPSLSSRCSSYAESAFTKSYLATATITSTPSLNGTQAYKGLKYSSPCCGQCWLTIPSVEVLYWPTPAVPGVSTLVSNGYTFRSPSVYIDFVTARAGDACGHPGNYSSRVTLGFDEKYLSTLHNNPGKATGKHGQIERPFNFADFNTLNCDQYKGSNISRTNNPWVNGNPCFPTVIAPSAASTLTALNPQWVGCRIQAQMFDPPRALTSVAAVGPTTQATPDPTSTPAKPSAIPEVIATQTRSPKPKITNIPFFGPIPGSDSGDNGHPNTGSTPNAGSNSGSGNVQHEGPKSVASTNGDSVHPEVEHKPSSIKVGGVGIFVPTQGQSSVVLGHQTASVGGPAITIADTPLSLGPSHLVVDGTQSHRLIPTAQPADPSVVAVGSHTVAIPAAGASTIAIGSQIASVGGPRVTIGDLPVSLGPSHLMVGSSTYALAATPEPAQQTPVVVAGHSIVLPTDGGSAITIGSQVVSAKGPAVTISNTPISLGNGALVVGTSTRKFLSPQPTIATPINIGGHQITPPFPGYSLVVGTHTLDPGHEITVSSTPVSLGNSVLVIGTSTIPLPTAGPQPVTRKEHYFAIGSQTIAVNPSGIVVGSRTLHPRGPAITVSGTSYSLGTTDFIAGSLTETFPAAAKPSHFRPAFLISGLSQIGASSVHDIVTVGGETIKLNPSNIIVHGTTLTPGASGITVDGTLVSLGTSELIIGDRTETFSNLLSAESTADGGLGAVTMSGFDQIGATTTDDPGDVPNGTAGVGTGEPSATGTAFTGSAVRSIALGGVAVASWTISLVALVFW